MAKNEEKSRRIPEENPKSSGPVTLGTFKFDPANGTLSALDGSVVTLRAQSSQVLAYLARHAGEVVNREVLIDAVWGDTFVTDDSLIQCISEIRKAIGDTDRSIVQTFPKKGYRLVPSGSDELTSDRDLVRFQPVKLSAEPLNEGLLRQAAVYSQRSVRYYSVRMENRSGRKSPWGKLGPTDIPSKLVAVKSCLNDYTSLLSRRVRGHCHDLLF